jgi:hypothetical protein
LEFLKNNAVKIALVAIALTGVILVLIPVFVASSVTFIGACQTIGVVMFFVGMGAVAAMKMCEKSKAYAKYVMVGASALVLLFMSIGLGGFCAKPADAHGAMGNAYAYFKSSAQQITDGQAKIAQITELDDNLKGAVALLTLPTAATTQLSAFKAEGVSQATLVAHFVAFITSDDVGAAKLPDAATAEALTVAVASGTVSAVLAGASAQLPENADALKKDANAGALTILFTYIAMMLGFGLVPAIFGTKKLICKSAA